MSDLPVKAAELSPDVTLKPHQKKTPQLLKDNDSQLLYWGIGSGKSLGSLSATESIEEPVNAVMPAALRNNYRKEVAKFVQDPGDRYNIVSLDKAMKHGLPERPVLAVDEVQRLRNQGSAYSAVLDAASKAKKRILLSGTPLVNGPEDMASIINLLHGQQLYTPDSFAKEFVGQHRNSSFFGLMGGEGVTPVVRNRSKLLKLLNGRVNYVSDAANSTKPTATVTDVPVPMSGTQDRLNQAIEKKLPFWARWSVNRNLPPEREKSLLLNSFMTPMREVSLSPAGFVKNMSPLKAFNESSKLQTAMDRIKEQLKHNKKVMVYSNFVESGLLPLAAGLQKAGIPFSMIHGGNTDASRKDAVDTYNSGKHQVILLGPAASEGVSLRKTNHVLLLDPAWTQARMDQAQGRAIRMDSHVDLPIKDRNVTIERLISEPRRGLFRRIFGMQPGVGSDRYLMARAAEKEKGIQAFLDVLKEAGK